ncbi:uncharacterized protein LOC119690061 [Teleopsis dalmanni]|uniref:uncharacterized protein LOC119690061 n=1 Tax=Teleopsis dalmanni TaxID=139649 RepID=UPI0018CF7468|nr:uncharacterized protein LOC119690061 [Teleopsis dalmanni]
MEFNIVLKDIYPTPHPLISDCIDLVSRMDEDYKVLKSIQDHLAMTEAQQMSLYTLLMRNTKCRVAIIDLIDYCRKVEDFDKGYVWEFINDVKRGLKCTDCIIRLLFPDNY